MDSGDGSRRRPAAERPARQGRRGPLPSAPGRGEPSRAGAAAGTDRTAPGGRGPGGDRLGGTGPDGTGPGATVPDGTVPDGTVPDGTVPNGPARMRARPPRDARDALAWLFIAALGFVAGQLVAFVLLALVAATLGKSADVARLSAQASPPGWVIVTGLVGVWIGFVGAVVLASRLRGTGRVAHDMGLRFRPWDLLLGPVVGVASQLLIPVLYLPLDPLVPNLAHRLSEPAKHLTGGFPGADLAVIGVLTVVVVPVVEELLFRGVVLQGFVRVFGRAGRTAGPVLAVLCTGVLFGLAHAETIALLGLAAFGVVLSVLAYRTGRLGPGILAHGAFNLVTVVSLAHQASAVRPW